MKRSGLMMLGVALVFCMSFALIGCSSESYKPETKDPQVSPPTIGTSGVLRVGVDADNAPFAGQSSGKISGLDVDIAAAIADELGLKLEIVDIGSKIDGSLEEGEVDIVMGVEKTNTSLSCWKSEVYIESGVALFAASETAKVPTSDSNPKIAAQTSSMSNWKVMNQFGNSALVPTSDLKTAFAQLDSGTSADYVAADAVIGSYAAQISGSEAHIIALLEKPSGYCIGVAKANTDLQNAITSALKTLSSTGVIGVIESKWLGSALDLSEIELTEKATQETREVVDAASSEGENSDENKTETSSDSANANAEGEANDEASEDEIDAEEALDEAA